MSERDPHPNPYRAPEGEMPPPVKRMSEFLGDEAKSEIDERKGHMADESTVGTIGLIHILMGLMAMVMVGATLSSAKLGAEIATQAATAKIDPAMIRSIMIGSGSFGLVLNLAIGLGLRGLKNWARRVGIVLSALGLLGKAQLFLNPQLLARALTPGLEMLATLFGTGLTIAMLILPRSEYVCSKHHHFVISETREIRPKMSLDAKLLVGTYLLTVVRGLASSF